MEKHKKLVRVVCLVLAALMVMTIGVPLIFAYAETPAEKLERLRKELEDIKSNISAVENSKEKSSCMTLTVSRSRIGAGQHRRLPPARAKMRQACRFRPKACSRWMLRITCF